jgi:N-methylhydantoinase B/oxoprolinase/acetone carboxylase alpha subunit
MNSTGGIDFNPAQMSMQVKKQGEDFKFDFNGTEIDAAQVTGATFTIRTMTPVTNLSLILGLTREQGATR